MRFDGQWATSFGQMTLRQDGDRVAGTYGRNGLENTIEGTVESGRFTFRYEEPNERGTGWFRLRRPSCFSGEYLAERNARPLPWQGWRGFDGLWDTSLGRLRLVQEGTRVWGTSEIDPGIRVEGTLQDAEGRRFGFKLEGSTLQGAGSFELDPLGYLLDGDWASDDEPSRAINGQRAMPSPRAQWLVVLEAYRQRALDDTELTLGRAMRELAARHPWTLIRHRHYDDEAGLLRWCRQLLYLPDPAVLVVIGRGATAGVANSAAGAGAKTGGLAGLIESLAFADSLKLLHLAAPGSLAAPEAGRVLKEAAFPVSGYAGTAQWEECGLADMVYLDMILNRGLPPDQAAGQLPQLVRFAGAEAVPGSPYQPAAFTFLSPNAAPAEPHFGPLPSGMSRSRLH